MFTLVILSTFRPAQIHPLSSTDVLDPKEATFYNSCFYLAFQHIISVLPFAVVAKNTVGLNVFRQFKKMVDILSAVLNPWKASQCKESIKERHTTFFSNINSIVVFFFNTRSKNMKRHTICKNSSSKIFVYKNLGLSIQNIVIQLIWIK